MALTVSRTCDDPESVPAHPASSTIKLDIGGVAYAIDICDEHLRGLTEQVQSLGFSPATMTVGHNRRAAYVTKSGRPFSTHEVRAWMREQGDAVSDVGRLPAPALEAYAAAH